MVEQQQQIPEFKLVLVGDGGVGKTTFVKRHLTGEFEKKYIPTLGVEVHPLKFTTNCGVICFNVWDTAGQEDYDRLRPLSYPMTDVFVVAFSVSSRPSFDNVRTKWLPEIAHHCPGTALVLVGCLV